MQDVAQSCEPREGNRLMKGAIFLDRDGVIIENRENYVREWNEVSFIPGVLETLRHLAELETTVVIVTNQACIGREIVTFEKVWEIQNRIVEEIHAAGGRIAKSYLCPHKPEDHCNCRKPKPGMLFRAATEFDMKLNESWMIGDSLTDIEASKAAGCRPILVQTGKGREQAGRNSDRELIVLADLKSAVNFILNSTTGL